MPRRVVVERHVWPTFAAHVLSFQDEHPRLTRLPDVSIGRAPLSRKGTRFGGRHEFEQRLFDDCPVHAAEPLTLRHPAPFERFDSKAPVKRVEIASTEGP